MKTPLILLMMILGTLVAQTALANPASDCAGYVASAVQAKAVQDFPGRDLTAVAPDLGNWDGGSVMDLDVKVVEANQSSDVVGVYQVMIDETCSIIGGPDLQH